jgi:outer membrane protein OmpA-like peptidoglycan-associated protein
VGFKAKGVGRSETPWAREDFLGRFGVYESTTDVGVGPGKSFGYTEWRIRGTGGRPPMSVIFDHANTLAIEVGRGATAAEGYLRLDDGDTAFEDVFVPPRLDDDYVVRYRAEADVHFDLGSATLTQDARNILGFMAASELAGVREAGAEIRFVGSADRVDVEWFNNALSRVRAENALQALMDILGPDLRASTITRGLGEDLAKLMGDPDRKNNPEARRVFILMNGRTIVTLRGAKSEGQ